MYFMVLYLHFICVTFYLPVYNKFKQSDSEKQKFSLKGKVNAE